MIFVARIDGSRPSIFDQDRKLKKKQNMEVGGTLTGNRTSSGCHQGVGVIGGYGVVGWSLVCIEGGFGPR